MASATGYVAVLILPGPRFISSGMCGSRGYAEAYLAWLRHREELTGGRVLSATVQQRALSSQTTGVKRGPDNRRPGPANAIKS